MNTIPERARKWIGLSVVCLLILVSTPFHEFFHKVGCELEGGKVISEDYSGLDGHITCSFPDTHSQYAIERFYAMPYIVVLFGVLISYIIFLVLIR